MRLKTDLEQMKFKYDEMTSFLFSIDCNQEDSGKFLWWSHGFESAMDYQAEELKKMKLDAFMPEGMAERHNLGFRSFLKTGVTQKLYNTFRVPFLTKSKYCEMVKVHAKPSVLSTPFKMTLMVYAEMSVEEPVDCIVTNSLGFIETCSIGFANILQNYTQTNSNGKPSILYFCPSLLSLFLNYSPKFAGRFHSIENMDLPVLKANVDSGGNETFVENFIWNAFDLAALIGKSQNALNEKLFLDATFDLYTFMHVYLNEFLENKQTSLVQLRIYKMNALNGQDFFFCFEVLSIKLYRELLRSSTKLATNPPIKWLMKLNSIERQLKKDKSVEHEQSNSQDDSSKSGSFQKLLPNDSPSQSQIAEPSRPHARTGALSKFAQKVKMVKQIIQYTRPLATSQEANVDSEQSWPRMKTAQEKSDDSENSAEIENDRLTLLEYSSGKEMLHFQSSFAQPSPKLACVSFAQRISGLLVVTGMVLLIFFAAVYAYANKVRLLDHRRIWFPESHDRPARFVRPRKNQPRLVFAQPVQFD